MKKPVVLVVDDEPNARSIVIDFLKNRYDCDFQEAENGEDAVNFTKANHCDIMILDIKMPKKSGMTVIKESKQINPSIDILILSAWISEEVAEEAIELGATDYTVKPVDLKVISSKFSNILKKRGQDANKT